MKVQPHKVWCYVFNNYPTFNYFFKRVCLCGSQVVCSFCNEKGVVTDTLTYKQLDDASRVLGTLLTAPTNLGGCGISKGDRVLLVYPPGVDFIVAFIGCLRAGVLGVPVYAPDPRQPKHQTVPYHHSTRLWCYCSINK